RNRSRSLGLRGALLRDLELQQARAGAYRLGAFTGVCVLGRAAHPGLEVFFGFPTGIDEVAVLSGDGAQQLEAEETRLVVHRPEPRGETPLQLRPVALFNLDRIDLHDSHGSEPTVRLRCTHSGCLSTAQPRSYPGYRYFRSGIVVP